jgi:hypothetical protein
MTRRRVALAALSLTALAALGAAAGCAKPKRPPGVRARFGVFFGGDVQEREELPLILDRLRQTHGIRIDFDETPSAPLRVTWEIEKPGTGRDGSGGLVDYGEVKTRTGARTLDIPLSFREGDKPGAWRVRVMLEEKELLNRNFRVVTAGTEAAPVAE